MVVQTNLQPAKLHILESFYHSEVVDPKLRESGCTDLVTLSAIAGHVVVIALTPTELSRLHRVTSPVRRSK